MINKHMKVWKIIYKKKSLIDWSHAKNNCLKNERVDRLTNFIVHEIWRCTLDMHISHMVDVSQTK